MGKGGRREKGKAPRKRDKEFCFIPGKKAASDRKKKNGTISGGRGKKCFLGEEKIKGGLLNSLTPKKKKRGGVRGD